MAGRFQNLKTEEKRTAFLELMTQPVGETRHKALATIMRKNNISFEEAKKIQAMKIIGVNEEELKELPRIERPNLSNLGTQL